MISLAVDWIEGPRLDIFRWIVLGSVALHVVAFVALPSATRQPFTPPTPVVVEVAEPPPAPPPEPTKEPAPESPPAVATVTPTTPRSNVAPAANAAPTQPSAAMTEAPMDFTNTVLSNDGPGLAVSGGGGPVATVAPTVAPPKTLAAPAPARVVPPSSLARRPRAPGLDAELERQYPTAARQSGISGNAVLRVRILPDGRIGDVHVVSESWAGFGPACDRTVRAARWEPPIDRDGTPVTTEITYTCRFEVRN